MRMPRLLFLFVLAPIWGCGRNQTAVKVPPPPDLSPQQTTAATPPRVIEPSTETISANLIPTIPSNPQKPLFTQLGLASWYGAPYHNRRASNGEVYDMNQMTAAHRTLPLNTVARVTNVKTGNSAIVRITDRGPFIGERMLDLSVAAAKAVDVWQPGTAWIRLDVLESPLPVDTGGKWAVQIGAFDTHETAVQMKKTLIERYHPERVLEFTGPTGEWVRVRVDNDDRALAEQISRSMTTPEGGVFLVRLD